MHFSNAILYPLLADTLRRF